MSDQHGGEYYRPVPMALWWLLARTGGGAAWPFQFAALALHALVAVLAGALARAAGESRAVATLACVLFFLAPQNLDAAYWFSASTDLIASAALLASLVLLARPALGAAAWLASVALAGLAYFSKESSLVLAPLALLMLSAGGAGLPRGRGVWHRPLPHALLAAAFVIIRCRVLHGWGGTSDPPASLGGKLLQILSGVIHGGTGTAALPEPLAWGLGAVALVCLARHAVRTPGAWQPAAFVGLALLPVLGADWATGARYFYLPAVGLAWLGARCLVAAAPAARVTVVGGLALLATLQAARRHADIADYDARLHAVRAAVVDGLRQGHAVFHVAAGIKDLDLAVKESPAVRAADGPVPRLLLLGDVPASFVLLPPSLGGDGDFLLARPPIPPSGAYRFGAARVVGLARRGDDPDLETVVARFSDLRSLRLGRAPDGAVTVRESR